MRDAKDVVPYDVVVILFVGKDSILPLKLDVFLFGRLIAYPYNVVINFDGSKPPALHLNYSNLIGIGNKRSDME